MINRLQRREKEKRGLPITWEVVPESMIQGDEEDVLKATVLDSVKVTI